MNEEDFSKLKEAIWITRLSRIHSEKRLLEIENYCRFLNVYYSFLTIVLSILAYLYKEEMLSLFAIIMSIFLLIAILFLDSQKFYERARNFRKNYTSLYRLELQLQHNSHLDNESISSIEKQYCKLMDSNNNHTTFDYYCALSDSHGEAKERRFTGWVPIEYYWGIVWRNLLKTILIIFPFACGYYYYISK